MIVDAFLFNNELDLLELRLGQLDEVVDYFVLTEFSHTFSGTPKPLVYQANQARFAKWNHKIISMQFNSRGVCDLDEECRQREGIVAAIRKLNPPPQSTLHFSDVDEIPNPEVLKQYRPSMGLMNLRQWTYYYNFNHLFDYGARSWSRARIGVVQHMYDHGSIGFRGGWPAGSDHDPNYPAFDNGGWHGSYFNLSVAQVRSKIHSFAAHRDLWPYIDARTDKQIASDIHLGKDIYHRYSGAPGSKPGNDLFGSVWVDTNVTADHRLPPYFLANRERFKMFTDAYFVETNKHLL